MSSLTTAQRILADTVSDVAQGGRAEVFSTRSGPSKALAILAVTSVLLGSGEAFAGAARDGRVLIREAREVLRDTSQVSRDVDRAQKAADHGNLSSVLGNVSSVLGVADRYERSVRGAIGLGQTAGSDNSTPLPATPAHAESGGSGSYQNAADFLDDFGVRPR